MMMMMMSGNTIDDDDYHSSLISLVEYESLNSLELCFSLLYYNFRLSYMFC